MPLSRNLGALISQEPSGPVQACNGTALPFTKFCLQQFLLSVFKIHISVTVRDQISNNKAIGVRRSLSDSLKDQGVVPCWNEQKRKGSCGCRFRHVSLSRTKITNLSGEIRPRYGQQHLNKTHICTLLSDHRPCLFQPLICVSTKGATGHH